MRHEDEGFRASVESGRRHGLRRGLDRVVRNSWVGRRTGWLRKHAPSFYRLVRRGYDRLTSSHRADGISPTQARALDEFLATTPPPLLARGVLEIGSDVQGRVLRALLDRGVPRVVGINPAIPAREAAVISATLPAGSVLESVDLRARTLAGGSFGAIFSIAVFEHLLDFDACLAEMHRILVPGGRVYAAFGPVWSSSLGHHVFAEVDGVRLRHWDPKLNPIEDHAHLLMTADELAQAVARTRGPALGSAAAEWVYRSDDLNRLFYEDYLAAFERSAFRIVRLTPDREHVSGSRLAELQRAHPGRLVFDVRNAEVILQRSS